VSKTKKREEHLTDEELKKAHGEPLPDREQMSIIRPEPYPYLPVEPPDGQYHILPVPPEEA
jgi:hypothetical protein